MLESNEVVTLTKQLHSTPYDPEIWLNRAHSLRLLGFPELGLGDAYKARLLVETALSTSTFSSSDKKSGLTSIPGFKEKVLKSFRRKTYDLHTKNPAWIRWADTVSTPKLLTSKVDELLKRLELQIWTELMEGLMAANCAVDYKILARQAVEKFPEDEYFPSEVVNADSWYEQRKALIEEAVKRGEMSEASMESTIANGGVYPVPYPWMSEENGFLGRDEEVFRGVQEDFKFVSKVNPKVPPFLAARKSQWNLKLMRMIELRGHTQHYPQHRNILRNRLHRCPLHAPHQFRRNNLHRQHVQRHHRC